MTTIQRLSSAMTAVTAIAAAALLVACGGGGDDAVANTGTSTGANPYVGTWKSACYDTDQVWLEASPNETLYATSTLTLAKITDTRLSMVLAYSYFRNATCAGTPLVTQTNSSPQSSVTLDGAVTVAGLAADKVTLNIGAIGGISAGTRIVLGGVSYPGDYFMSTQTGKDLFRVVGTSLYLGNDDTVDAQGYPTAIDPEDPLTRQ